MTKESERGNLSREQLFQEKYRITIAGGGDSLWDTHGEAALALFQETFPSLIPEDVIRNGFHGWPADSLITSQQIETEDKIFDPDTTFVALQERDSHTLRGYTYAFADDFIPRTPAKKQEFVTLNMSLPAYKVRQNRTAEVGYTVITPEHRATGSWSHMMDALEAQLITRNFNEMVRCVRQEDKYADKLRRRYEGRIVTEIQNIPSAIGLQTYFRITL